MDSDESLELQTFEPDLEHWYAENSARIAGKYGAGKSILVFARGSRVEYRIGAGAGTDGGALPFDVPVLYGKTGRWLKSGRSSDDLKARLLAQLLQACAEHTRTYEGCTSDSAAIAPLPYYAVSGRQELAQARHFREILNDEPDIRELLEITMKLLRSSYELATAVRDQLLFSGILAPYGLIAQIQRLRSECITGEKLYLSACMVVLEELQSRAC